MAGDLPIIERARLASDRSPAGATIHRYGRLGIEASHEPPEDDGPALAADLDYGVELTEIEQVGLAALRLRESPGYRRAKQHRPRDGEEWDMSGCTAVAPVPPTDVALAAGGPTSAYLEGTVAVGIIVVDGPTADLQFTEAERTKVVAEVQNGLGFFAITNPRAGISFAYDIRFVTIDTAPDRQSRNLEGLWRNPAMAVLGYTADWAGVGRYVEDIRTRLGTRWTYCGFFTKYPLDHFAYASIGGPRLVVDYRNDGWGPDNIDRVFAHETGHIFGCPDEYASSGCDCEGRWGRFGAPNGNCANCAGDGGVVCLMKDNDFAMCPYTPRHLGWEPPVVTFDVGGNDPGRPTRPPPGQG